MHYSSAQLAVINTFWALSFAFQTLTALLILRRKQTRNFPIFFAYTLFHLVQAISAFAAYRLSYTFYFYVYWIGETLDGLVTLAVIQEIFRVTLYPYLVLRRWGTRLYIGLAFLLCLLVLFMATQKASGHSDLLVLALLVLQRSAAIVQLGLIVFLFLFCRLFGLTWRHYVFGMATGFALMAAVYSLSAAIQTYFGSSLNSWIGMAESAAFTAAIAIWMYYFASSRSRVPLDQVPGTERLVAWNRALANLGRD